MIGLAKQNIEFSLKKTGFYLSETRLIKALHRLKIHLGTSFSKSHLALKAIVTGSSRINRWSHLLQAKDRKSNPLYLFGHFVFSNKVYGTVRPDLNT